MHWTQAAILLQLLAADYPADAIALPLMASIVHCAQPKIDSRLTAPVGLALLPTGNLACILTP